MQRTAEVKHVTVSPVVHRKFKLFCMQQGLPIRDVADEALQDWMRRKNRRNGK